MGQLTGKRALVTGGGQGIGKAIAEGLLRAGCDVAINLLLGRKGRARGGRRWPSRSGARPNCFQADLSNEERAPSPWFATRRDFSADSTF